MDLVHTWYDDRYWSKVFISSISTYDHNLGVKVMDLELLCYSFCVKVFRSSLLHYLLMDLVHSWYDDRYWSKVFIISISAHERDLGVKVTDLEFLCLSFLKLITSLPSNGFSSYLI